MEKKNIILIVSDTMRMDYLGCYGNQTIHTPNLDRFAQDCVRFTNAHPEALPTIPVRRTLHSGRRGFPFRGYKPQRWDVVNEPGWQPMDPDKDSVAENLAQAGYYTGFATDTLPYFGPGMNYTRGFWQWEYIRGHSQDKWKSSATATDAQLSRYARSPEEARKNFPADVYAAHAANSAGELHEEDTTTARVFRWGMDFLEDNARVKPFYLMLDCFDPHEPWEAPRQYYSLYGDYDKQGKLDLWVPYGPVDETWIQEKLPAVHNNYMGKVSLVDAWFGRFLETLKRLGLYDNSLIIFTADHGTNFTDNPDHVVGKPCYSLFPGVMNVPLLVHFPGGEGAGRVIDTPLYNVDIPATVYAYSGAQAEDGCDGICLHDYLEGRPGREYLTCRYDEYVWYYDRASWMVFDIHGQPKYVFDCAADPHCRNNLAALRGKEDPAVAQAWQRILRDAGGEIPTYDIRNQTDAVGRLISLTRKGAVAKKD